MRRVGLFICIALLAAGAKAAQELPEPSREHAFAALSGTRNDGTRYHPFYGLVITPHAVVGKGTVYCAFQNTRGRPIVMAYDIERKAWGGPVVASTFGLGGDDHGNPSVYLDRRGHLHLFYGCHGGPMRHTRTTRPHDISEWSKQKSPTRRATYPQSMRLADGTVCLFYRAGGHMSPWALRTSGDDCATWSKGRRVIEMRVKPRDPRAAAYCDFFPGAHGKTVHCFWNFKDDNPRRRPKAYPRLHEAVYRYNIYYIRRDPDGTWHNAAGEVMGLPVSRAAADAKCLLYDSGKQFAYPNRVAVDRQDRPYLRLRTGVQDWRKGRRVVIPMRLKYATWRDEAWRVSDELPGDWPEEAAAVVGARGFPAFGDSSYGRWFIFYTRFRPSGTGLFLYDERSGYATREGGPADVSK
jgi:hypothetical protein